MTGLAINLNLNPDMLDLLEKGQFLPESPVENAFCEFLQEEEVNLQLVNPDLSIVNSEHRQGQLVVAEWQEESLSLPVSQEEELVIAASHDEKSTISPSKKIVFKKKDNETVTIEFKQADVAQVQPHEKTLQPEIKLTAMVEGDGENTLPQPKVIQDKEVKLDISYTQAPHTVVMDYLRQELKGEDLSFFSSQMGSALSVMREEAGEDKPVDDQSVLKAKVQLTNPHQAKLSLEDAPKHVDLVQASKVLKSASQPIVINQNQEMLAEQEGQEMTLAQAEQSEQRISETVLNLKSAERQTETTSKDSIEIKGLDITAMIKTSPIDVKAAPMEKVKAAVQPYLLNPAQLTQQVASHMKEALDVGMDKVTVHLNPPALGKVEVELRFQEDGRIAAVFNLDNSDTFDLLQRNAHALKEALEEAGFQSSTSDFAFNLSQQENPSAREDKNGSSTELPRQEAASDKVMYAANGLKDLTKEVDIHA